MGKYGPQQQQQERQPDSGLLALDSPTVHLRSIKAQERPPVFIICAGSVMNPFSTYRSTEGGMMRKSPDISKKEEKEKEKRNGEENQKKKERITYKMGSSFMRWWCVRSALEVVRNVHWMLGIISTRTASGAAKEFNDESQIKLRANKIWHTQFFAKEKKKLKYPGGRNE